MAPCLKSSAEWRARHLKVIRKKCSEALHILDRFHIVATINKALDEVSAGESRRMALEGLALAGCC
jgi:hypothetical protein